MEDIKNDDQHIKNEAEESEHLKEGWLITRLNILLEKAEKQKVLLLILAIVCTVCSLGIIIYSFYDENWSFDLFIILALFSLALWISVSNVRFQTEYYETNDKIKKVISLKKIKKDEK